MNIRVFDFLRVSTPLNYILRYHKWTKYFSKKNISHTIKDVYFIVIRLTIILLENFFTKNTFRGSKSEIVLYSSII